MEAPCKVELDLILFSKEKKLNLGLLICRFNISYFFASITNHLDSLMVVLRNPLKGEWAIQHNTISSLSQNSF
jgi:hypothetical protein